MKFSVCTSTYNHSKMLLRMLESIDVQQNGDLLSGQGEVIVVDDGSTDDTQKACELFADGREWFRYIRLAEAVGKWRNPAIPRNVAMRAAAGQVLILQSDEVIHHSPNVLKRLCDELLSGHFLIATVFNAEWQNGEWIAGRMMSGDQQPRLPVWHKDVFYLGAVLRKHVYAIGGNEERFVGPAPDDLWFTECLRVGQLLDVQYDADIVGFHQSHPPCSISVTRGSKQFGMLREQAKRSGKYVTHSGPWKFNDG